jgi:hypothetical protein
LENDTPQKILCPTSTRFDRIEHAVIFAAVQIHKLTLAKLGDGGRARRMRCARMIVVQIFSQLMAQLRVATDGILKKTFLQIARQI